MNKKLLKLSISPSWWTFTLTVIATVILVTGRALLLNWRYVPLSLFLMYGVIALPVWLLGNFVIATIAVKYEEKVLSKWFAKRIGLYLLALYGLQLIYRINAKRLLWWDFVKLNFFQYETLLLLLPAIILFFLARRYQAVRTKLPSHLTGQWVFHDWSALLVTIGLQLSPLAVSYWKDLFREEFKLGDYVGFFWQVPFRSALAIVVTYFCLIYLRNATKDVIRNKSSFASSFIISLILAIICHIFYQASMAGSVTYFSRYFFPGAILFQIACLTMLNIIITMIINRQTLSTLLIMVLNASLITANFLKFKYRSEPLTPNDFKWVGDLGMIFSFINPTIAVIVGLAILGLISVYLYIRKRYFVGIVEKSLKKRLVTVLIILLLLFGMGTAIRHEKDHKIIDGIPLLSSVNNWRNVDWKGYTFVARYRTLSFLWLQQLSKESMHRPDGYSKEAMAKIIKKYKAKAKELNKTRERKISDQTVIYILSESLADPERLSNVTISQKILPKIRNIMSQTTSGLMKSDHYGGGTANIEFQVYSGLPFYNYNSSISAVYLDIAPSMKKFPSISDLYQPSERIGIHPYYGTSYNRNNIYEQLGFDKFLTLNSKTNPIDVLPEDYRGNFVSDEKTYNLILENIVSGQNQFISAMTMQNHVEWNSPEPMTITAFGNNFTEEENKNLTNYVRLLSFTDTATEQFLEKLKYIDKDITVVFYGDHLPGLYPESTFADDPTLQYKTDYFIWSNYDMEMKHYPLVNSSDLTALMLETTQSKVTPYYALLTEVLHKASVGGKVDKTVANDLKLVQYDLTTGEGYLTKDKHFFTKID